MHHTTKICPHCQGPCQSTTADGCNGPPGPHGHTIASPTSVTTIECIHLRWEYIAGDELRERREIWQNNELLTVRDRSLGIRPLELHERPS